MESIQTELLVIGWGKAGKTVAKKYAAAGHDVTLVERSPQMYGGSCINVACIPTKDLVASAEERPEGSDPQEYFTKSVAARDALISKLNAKNYAMLDGKARLIDGEASFVDPSTVKVTTASGEVRIKADHIIVSTGTTPARPDIPGIDLPGVYNSETIQHADPFPRSLVIIGGGFVGLEFASMFGQFGADVTVLDRRDAFLPQLEPEVSAEVHRVLGTKSVRIELGVSVDRIEEYDEGLRVVAGERTFEGAAVLLAVGRTPATAALNLGAAGIDTDERGFIKVDEHLRTSAPNVWATGDVNGGPQFTYISLDDSRIVLDQLTGEGERTTGDRVAVANTTFLTPPLAQVGVGPREAQKDGHKVLYASAKVADLPGMPRPKILGHPEGVLTLTADADTHTILGATLFGTDAQETINTVALAIRLGATYETLRDGIWIHPSSTEGFNDLLGGIKPYEGPAEVE